MSFIQDYWWGTLFGAILLAWTWRTWRRVTRLSALTRGLSHPASEPRSATPALLRRADVENACQELRRREPPLLELVIVCLIVGVPFVAAALLPDSDARMVLYVEPALL